MRAVRRVVTALVLAGVALLPAGAEASGVPTAHPVTSIPSVAAVFAPSVAGLGPRLHLPHTCTAVVLRTATRTVALTAAHCVAGLGAGIEIAPGFHDGVAPHGTWDVTAVYVDPAWLTRQDPHRDLAVLVVAPRRGRRLGDVVHGHRLGAARTGSAVKVAGYPAGADGRPVRCSATLRRTMGYPRLDCHGFVGGTSGGPWIQAHRVVGVIGGFEQGGCTEMTSYSAPFGTWVETLVRRAQAGGPGDVVPAARPSGC